METSNSPNGQNDHFDHDHNTILSSKGHGKMVKINRYFKNFNDKKSGIVEIVMIQFLLTMKISEFWGWLWSKLA
jgi:hypothetical protein